MKVIFTIFFLTVTAAVFSQNLTGIWRGTFVQRQPNPFTGEWQSDVYKYEVQIHQLNSKNIEGVTYSYRQKEFYGKSAFKGLYTKATKNVLLKETKMLELKTQESSEPCLMTCYLDYSKDGNVEKLTGTFSSVGASDKNDCGGGTVTLQRTLHSDFKKENFLEKNNTANKKINSTKKYIQTLQKALGLNADGIVGPKTLQAVKQKIPTFNNKLNVNDSVEIKNLIAQIETKKNKSLTAKASINKPKSSETIVATVLPSTPKKIITDTTTKRVATEKFVEVPAILKSRTNKLVNTIVVNEKDITVDYYDNGEIDGDIISVYDNNKRVINYDTLSTKPLRLNIHLDENNSTHELITVAENLGSIPPNTCLMVVTAGKKRIEVPMSSDEHTNAKIIIEYEPKEGTKIEQ